MSSYDEWSDTGKFFAVLGFGIAVLVGLSLLIGGILYWGETFKEWENERETQRIFDSDDY